MKSAKSSYDAWHARVMTNPALSWTRPRTVRRQLVIAFCLVLLGFMAAMWAYPTIWWIVALMIVLVPLMGMLNGGTRGLSELRQYQLDEREGRTRDEAYRKVYWPALAIQAAGAYALLHGGMPAVLQAAVGFSTFILALMMPVLYLAWTLPEDAGEDG